MTKRNIFDHVIHWKNKGKGEGEVGLKPRDWKVTHVDSTDPSEPSALIQVWTLS